MGIPVDQTRFRGWLAPLMYLQAEMDTDLVFVVCMWCLVSKAKPTKKHFEAIKRVFWYLKGTINMGLWYPNDNTLSINSFRSDRGSCGVSQIQEKYVGECSVSCIDRLVSWSSKKQTELRNIKLQMLNTSPCLMDVVLKSLDASSSSKRLRI
ncbi:hypothetical protein Tco_0032687 [Tanacetum coccineum]